MDYIYIARPGEETLIDSVPFAEAEEIKSIESLDDNHTKASRGIIFEKPERNGIASRIHPDNSAETSASKIRSTLKKFSQNSKLLEGSSTSLFGGFKADKEESKAMLHINTVPDGFNSGVIYILI
jgi:hypothetical protein